MRKCARPASMKFLGLSGRLAWSRTAGPRSLNSMSQRIRVRGVCQGHPIFFFSKWRTPWFSEHAVSRGYYVPSCLPIEGDDQSHRTGLEALASASETQRTRSIPLPRDSTRQWQCWELSPGQKTVEIARLSEFGMWSLPNSHNTYLQIWPSVA